MTGPARPAAGRGGPGWSVVPADDRRYRPLYARLLGLRIINPGAVLCFLFFEGAVAFAVLLALAELVSWWAVAVLPLAVAIMVKLNDEVAGRVVHSAALVPEQERDRFRRELEPIVGRAPVPYPLPGTVVTDAPAPGRPTGPPLRPRRYHG
ncbi:hypothetical protein ACN261_02120 [Micromonospora sp. WMMD723]|uniref:hypothetical protein n=1 Tax=unclassified Micromonospora TaxID=2617518 RepID=UPI003B928412